MPYVARTWVAVDQRTAPARPRERSVARCTSRRGARSRSGESRDKANNYALSVLNQMVHSILRGREAKSDSTVRISERGGGALERDARFT